MLEYAYSTLMYIFTHILPLPHTHTHTTVYYGVPVQLPVDEIPLLVASSPLAGFKPGSVYPRPQRERRAIYKCDDCCPAFSPVLCKNQPMTSLPPTLAPVAIIPLAPEWLPQNRAASSSHPHLTVISATLLGIQ